MIDKLKEVLNEYLDEPCVLQGVKCKECKFNIYMRLWDEDDEQVRMCDVLEELSGKLEVD
jgi:hypothetical protein